MAVQDNEYLPTLMNITQAAYNDVTFFKNVKLPRESTVIMDRGYRDHNLFNQWTSDNIRWVTRIHPNGYYVIEHQFHLVEESQRDGVTSDAQIQLGHPAKKVPKVNCRLIKFTAPTTGKYFEFITNDFKSKPEQIADLYKKRWRIELVFKRLKQNMPLKYFLGDNKNAIQIQIWTALIADLLLQVIIGQVKRKWAFSNVVSLIRLHLFNYLDLLSFLENPEKATIITAPPNNNQISLQFSG